MRRSSDDNLSTTALNDAHFSRLWLSRPHPIRHRTNQVTNMGKLIKYLIIGALFLGVYTFANAFSVGREHKEFVNNVEYVIQQVQASWSEEQGEEAVRDLVLRAARDNGLELDKDNVQVKYSRRESAVGGETPYTKYNRGNNTIETGTMQSYQVFARATVTVTYERVITPFYTKQLKFTRSSKQVR